MTAQSRPYELPVSEVLSLPAPRTHHIALASATSTVALVLYTACRVVSVASPGLLIWFLEPWFHGIALETSLAAISVFQPAEFVIGFFTFGGTVWLSTYFAARLYHAWSR